MAKNAVKCSEVRELSANENGPSDNETAFTHNGADNKRRQD